MKKILTIAGIWKIMKRQTAEMKACQSLIKQQQAQINALKTSLHTHGKKYQKLEIALQVINNSTSKLTTNWWQLGNDAYGLSLIALKGYEKALRGEMRKQSAHNKEHFRNYMLNLNQSLEQGNSTKYKYTDRQSRFIPENYQPIGQ